MAPRFAQAGPKPGSSSAARLKRLAGLVHVVRRAATACRARSGRRPSRGACAIASSRSRAAASKSLTSMQTLAVATSAAGVRPPSSTSTQSRQALGRDRRAERARERMRDRRSLVPGRKQQRRVAVLLERARPLGFEIARAASSRDCVPPVWAFTIRRRRHSPPVSSHGPSGQLRAERIAERPLARQAARR